LTLARAWVIIGCAGATGGEDAEVEGALNCAEEEVGAVPVPEPMMEESIPRWISEGIEADGAANEPELWEIGTNSGGFS
jgi:hypothetical protein